MTLNADDATRQGALEDSSNNAIRHPASGSLVDLVAPRIDEAWLASASEVRVAFTEDVAVTFTAGDWTLAAGGEALGTVTGAERTTSASATLTISPPLDRTSLPSGATLAYAGAGSVTDASAQSNALATVDSVPLVDRAPPELRTAEFVDEDTVRVTFSEAIGAAPAASLTVRHGTEAAAGLAARVAGDGAPDDARVTIGTPSATGSIPGSQVTFDIEPEGTLARIPDGAYWFHADKDLRAAAGAVRAYLDANVDAERMVLATDAPGTTALTVAVRDGGASADRTGDNAEYANEGDRVTISVTFDEAVATAGAGRPMITVTSDADASPTPMVVDDTDATTWTHSFVVDSDVADGPLLFTIVASDTGDPATEGTLTQSFVQGANAIIDQTAPKFAASTASVTQARIDFSERVTGTVTAAAWAVEGAASATPSHTALDERTSITLDYAAMGTGATPLITYTVPTGEGTVPLADAAGNEMAGAGVPASDGVRPTVLRADLVAHDMFEVEFSEIVRIDPGNRWEDLTTPGGTSLPVGAALSEGTTTTLRYDLDASAVPGTTYTIPVPNSVKDEAGNRVLVGTTTKATYYQLAPMTQSRMTTLIGLDGVLTGTLDIADWSITGDDSVARAIESIEARTSDGTVRHTVTGSTTATLATADAVERLLVTHAPLRTTASTPEVAHAQPATPLRLDGSRIVAAQSVEARDGVPPAVLSAILSDTDGTAGADTIAISFSEGVTRADGVTLHDMATGGTQVASGTGSVAYSAGAAASSVATLSLSAQLAEGRYWLGVEARDLATPTPNRLVADRLLTAHDLTPPTITDTRFDRTDLVITFDEEVRVPAGLALSVERPGTLDAVTVPVMHDGAVITLALGDDASAAGTYTATIPATITNIAYAPRADSAATASATYALPSAELDSAETRSSTLTVVTFTDAVTGATAAADWALSTGSGATAASHTVLGVAPGDVTTVTADTATGRDTAVSFSTAGDKVTLLHEPIPTDATPQVTYPRASPSRLVANSVDLAADTTGVPATDGAPPEMTARWDGATGPQATVIATFSEAVSLASGKVLPVAGDWSVV
ncbi:MAG: hypothetical protein OXU61_04630, partial [Gammaproteobacteria bacterium]|nr:hypothetical protein [Gammaproteobacteria bacterium]